VLTFLLGTVAFVGVMVVGDALGVHPSLAEALLVVGACLASDAVRMFRT
jgi:hypothetical protein